MGNMKFRFTIQPYQTEAVESVTDVFAGQPFQDRDTCHREFMTEQNSIKRATEDEKTNIVYANAQVQLDSGRLLENIRRVQARNHIRIADAVVSNGPGVCSLDVEMETGTGKTYVYIKTMFELNKQYGWSKFIVVVPSIAIREGVSGSFETMQEHFMEYYGKKARFFVYDSKNLSKIDDFSQSADINVMIINIQAFNSAFDEKKKNSTAKIINSERDDFGGRKPADVIAASRPIVIVDEPQKMGGPSTQEGIRRFRPLFCLNYSATHKQHHTLVYVLDALDAYNKRLVKKIEVKGFAIKNLGGTDRYLYLERIILSPKKPPMARLEFEIGYGEVIRRETRLVGVDADLFALSGNMEQYRGFRVNEIDPFRGTLLFANGEMIRAGEAAGDISETDLRRVQIRETIRSHFEKEKELFSKGIKVLSLFFIDEVAKYRRYDAEGKEINSEYGTIFEQEYTDILNGYLGPDHTPYEEYLRRIDAHQTHSGYFSIDKKGHKVDGSTRRGSEESDDISAYDLILKDKEKLLSFSNPVRFIFSHSALGEGWDNPNVFQICTLKHGGSSPAQKRQEVGRGLRLCVNQNGDRMDADRLGSQVQQVNRLTVIASDGYKEFVADLQQGIREDLCVTDRHPEDLTGGLPARGPESCQETGQGAHAFIRGVWEEHVLDGMIDNGHNTKIQENALNDNFYRKEFQELWNNINHKYAYTVAFDSEAFIRKAIDSIDEKMYVARMEYTVTMGEQGREWSPDQLRDGEGFGAEKSRTFSLERTEGSLVKYDLVGRVAEGAKLTRRSAARILSGIKPSAFAMFRNNPEEFIAKAIRFIEEQRAAMIADRITYNRIDGSYDNDIFTAEKNMDISKAYRAKKNVQDYVFFDECAGEDRTAERRFAEEMDSAEEVCVYAKLPKGFLIPTPVGSYSPDWAIVFHRGRGKHRFCVVSLNPKPMEKAKIDCVQKLFQELFGEDVVYGAVDSYRHLWQLRERRWTEAAERVDESEIFPIYTGETKGTQNKKGACKNGERTEQ